MSDMKIVQVRHIMVSAVVEFEDGRRGVRDIALPIADFAKLFVLRFGEEKNGERELELRPAPNESEEP